MARMDITSREQACFYLGVNVFADEETVKKAYRDKVKLYHPDSDSGFANVEYFRYIQQSYEFLMSKFGIAKNNQNVQNLQTRPVRVFQTNTNAQKQFQKQKSTEKDRELLHQWEEKKKKECKEQNASEKRNIKQGKSISKEEEILNQIRAIWLAESIHRQIEREKEQTEIENKRKLYRAFMQQQISDQDDFDYNK